MVCLLTNTSISASPRPLCILVYQVCPIKQDKTVGGLGSEEEVGVEGGARCRVTVKKKRREMARGVRALMHSLCAGRILLQSRNTHKRAAGALCLSERSPCRPGPERERGETYQQKKI